jgi:hypothetical protein
MIALDNCHVVHTCVPCLVQRQRHRCSANPVGSPFEPTRPCLGLGWSFSSLRLNFTLLQHAPCLQTLFPPDLFMQQYTAPRPPSLVHRTNTLTASSVFGTDAGTAGPPGLVRALAPLTDPSNDVVELQSVYWCANHLGGFQPVRSCARVEERSPTGAVVEVVLAFARATKLLARSPTVARGVGTWHGRLPLLGALELGTVAYRCSGRWNLAAVAGGGGGSSLSKRKTSGRGGKERSTGLAPPSSALPETSAPTAAAFLRCKTGV